MDDGLVAGLTGSTAAAVASAELASLAAGDGPQAGKGHGASTTCLNCSTALAPKARFCSQCGQDTANHPPSLFEFVHEFVSHYIAVEGTLWKSLWGLMARPGFLTLEYLAGRKQRYVLPLRLLLTLGLLFFLALKFAPGGSKATALGEFFADDDEVVASAPAASATPRKSPSGEAKLPEAMQDRVERAENQWRADPRGTANAIGATMLGLAPYAVLCSLPFFAGLLKLLFWRQPYGAHFVFAMHLHAAWYA
ncbi:MAG: DUF3667 domain-containing protein, partial [Rubrivivax sp.]